MKIQSTVIASEVGEGDFLIDLDNGYVYEDPQDASEVLCWQGWGYGSLDADLTYIPFHTAQGDEAFLVVPSDFEIRVQR